MLSNLQIPCRKSALVDFSHRFVHFLVINRYLDGTIASFIKIHSARVTNRGIAHNIDSYETSLYVLNLHGLHNFLLLWCNRRNRSKQSVLSVLIPKSIKVTIGEVQDNGRTWCSQQLVGIIDLARPRVFYCCVNLTGSIKCEKRLATSSQVECTLLSISGCANLQANDNMNR